MDPCYVGREKRVSHSQSSWPGVWHYGDTHELEMGSTATSTRAPNPRKLNVKLSGPGITIPYIKFYRLYNWKRG